MTSDDLHDFALIGAAIVVVCVVAASDPRGDELGLIKRVLLGISFASLFMAVYLIAVLM
jgi:ABC-type Fe3+-siderophore transport system permease subunit